eukprot:CAMPEP_0169284074 /NCGR_PEP_ID=MMETSP1016-20121227/57915_1 /TAXON_ID=342587 /ORGANISM="Karlodinium micrum, Strain CCMP2283" /LENGTH=69 /DNA_ID=CAMNT_0009373379 /DNA_START=446 /DNA_END=652 /DNA_ORIENTATION=+
MVGVMSIPRMSLRAASFANKPLPQPKSMILSPARKCEQMRFNILMRPERSEEASKSLGSTRPHHVRKLS